MDAHGSKIKILKIPDRTSQVLGNLAFTCSFSTYFLLVLPLLNVSAPMTPNYLPFPSTPPILCSFLWSWLFPLPGMPSPPHSSASWKTATHSSGPRPRPQSSSLESLLCYRQSEALPSLWSHSFLTPSPHPVSDQTTSFSRAGNLFLRARSLKAKNWEPS